MQQPLTTGARGRLAPRARRAPRASSTRYAGTSPW